MRAVRLHIPGEFEDAFLYMGRLALLTRAGTLQMVSLDRTLQRSSSPGMREVLRLLFERNDRLSKKTATAAAGTPRKLFQIMKTLSDSGIHAEEPSIEAELSFGLTFRVPLDLRIYYSRAYLATEHGLHSMDVDFDSKPVEAKRRATRRTEARCLAIAARYGLVHASCESEGLYSSVDEFGWLSDNGRPHAFKRTAPKSGRVSWLSFGFVNYPEPGAPSVYPTRMGRIPSTSDRSEDSEAIVAIEPAAEWPRSANSPAADADFVWSSLAGLFVNSPSRGLLFFRADRPKDKSLDPSPPSRIQRYMAGLSWAGTYGGGIVLDTDEGIVALENHQTLVLEREPAIAVKTYPNSQWYRRLASVITEDGVNLIAMLRDSYFEDPEEDV